MGQGNCFFTMNKEEEEEEEEKVEKVEEDEIRTRVQSSAPMQQSCTHRPRQLFFFSFQ